MAKDNEQKLIWFVVVLLAVLGVIDLVMRALSR